MNYPDRQNVENIQVYKSLFAIGTKFYTIFLNIFGNYLQFFKASEYFSFKKYILRGKISFPRILLETILALIYLHDNFKRQEKSLIPKIFQPIF